MILSKHLHLIERFDVNSVTLSLINDVDNNLNQLLMLQYKNQAFSSSVMPISVMGQKNLPDQSWPIVKGECCYY